MPKPTTEIQPNAADVPFYFVRLSPALFQAVDAHRLAIGYNKKKTLEVMAQMFLDYKPSVATAAKVIIAPKKKTKKAKK